jgi:hypothetical protein
VNIGSFVILDLVPSRLLILPEHQTLWLNFGSKVEREAQVVSHVRTLNINTDTIHREYSVAHAMLDFSLTSRIVRQEMDDKSDYS